VSSEIETKTQRIVELLAKEKLGGVLLNAQHNFAWITGGRSNGVDLSRENGAASVFVRADGKRFLLANSIETPRLLAEEVSTEDFEPVEFTWQDEKAEGALVIRKAHELADGDIATDLLFENKTPLLESEIAQCRFELTAAEIERYRSLGKDAALAMSKTIHSIRPGESEIDIAAKLRAELAVKNINSVVTLAAADERIAAFRHPVPTEKRLRKVLLLVTCSKRSGLIASLSRMICVGQVPDELQARTEAAAFVNAMLSRATRLGVTGPELYETAAHAYANAGFPDEINLHHQGGATGYRTREWVAHPKSREVVKDNQAFAWNPSISGTKIEETFIVTSIGIENLTNSEDTPKIETKIDGRIFESPGIIGL